MAIPKSHKKGLKKCLPSSDTAAEEMFAFPYITDPTTIKFLEAHERIMFIIRGPPGTSKHRLTSLLQNRYPSSVMCSADSYFDSKFGTRTRDRETLKASHDFCERRVTEECEKGTLVVIVQNSHIKIWEARPYVHLAAKHGYTVIMAITLRKIYVNEEVLESTNRKGLNKDYFAIRLKQWREYIPLYLGWFLSPDDSMFVLHQGKKALASLVGDGKFCKVFDAYSEDEILDYFKVRTALFCIAGYCGCDPRNKKWYLSMAVQEAYGKCFKLSLHGFIISKSLLLAVAAISTEAKHLLVNPNEDVPPDVDNTSAFEKMNIHAELHNVTSIHKICELKHQITEESQWETDEALNINNLSVMILSASGKNPKFITDVREFMDTAFSGITSPEGEILVSELLEFDNCIKYTRLPNDAWFVLSSKKREINTVFTGLYT